MSESHVLQLARDVAAVRTARGFVRETVGDLVGPDLLADALVVTSELVTNAVVHAGTVSELEVRAARGRVEVRLSDDDPRPPVRRALLGGPAAQGRGLTLLSGLADRWGVEERHDGKTVWAVLTETP